MKAPKTTLWDKTSPTHEVSVRLRKYDRVDGTSLSVVPPEYGT